MSIQLVDVLEALDSRECPIHVMDSIIPVMLCAKPDVLNFFLILSCWLTGDPYTEVNMGKVLKLCLSLWGYIWLHLMHHIEIPVLQM